MNLWRTEQSRGKKNKKKSPEVKVPREIFGYRNHNIVRLNSDHIIVYIPLSLTVEDILQCNAVEVFGDDPI